MQGKNGIEFKPLTPGLGFHPFSDGLPYAPVSKSTSRPQATPHSVPGVQGVPGVQATGSGAVAAGQPSFTYPKRPPVQRVSVPIAQPTVRQPNPIRVEKPVAPTAAPDPVFAPAKFGAIYLFKRILAYALDTVLNTALLATGLSFALLNENLSPDLLMNPGIALISVLFFILFSWALITAQEIAFGTTIGKRVFGLMLHGSTSAIFLRAFFFLPSIGFCGMGLLWAVFDPRRRCWHDVVVNAQPVEVARL